MNISLTRSTLLAVAVFLPVVFAQHGSMPPGTSHEEHMKQMSRNADMKKRGDAAMGFDQEKVRHHFLLTKQGGMIEVAANERADSETRKQIRAHLQLITRDFTQGLFSSPMQTHAEVPPGVPVLRDRKDQIKYKYEETPNGARVVIATADRSARKAIHSFLRYQIREHATGDPEYVGIY
ncbi:MAG: hypothetical protein ABJF23_17565 [Bryobacteraceae bacterium]